MNKIGTEDHIKRIGQEYSDFLADSLTSSWKWGLGDSGFLRFLENNTEHLLLDRAREAEAELSTEQVKAAQEQCRSLLRPIWDRGAIGHEITHWPDGPGSSRAMSLIYDHHLPTNDVASHYSEWFLLTRDLAEAVRSRKNILRDLLVTEINSKSGEVKVADIACGPCQSLREALCSIKDPERVSLTAVDTDELVQNNNHSFFNKSRGLDFNFQVNSALRVKYEPESMDLIYSTGLYDYLPSSLLTRLWSKTFTAIKPGGLLALSMKDCSKFCPLFYRWAIEWNQFFLRTDEEILSIVQQSGLPAPEDIHRDSTGIIMMILVRKPS